MKITLLSYTPNPETNIANAARICYDSKPKTLEDERKFIKGLVKSGHCSTIEHSSATFRIDDVSRALTHELVRHRLFSFSQRSQRYVKENTPHYVTPEIIDREFTSDDILSDEHSEAKLSAAKLIYEDAMKHAWFAYKSLLDLGLKAEDARYVLPNSCCTSITVSGNFREWRNFLELRLSPRAQWEIRHAANVILDELIKIAPSVFEDLKEIDQK